VSSGALVHDNDDVVDVVVVVVDNNDVVAVVVFVAIIRFCCCRRRDQTSARDITFGRDGRCVREISISLFWPTGEV